MGAQQEIDHAAALAPRRHEHPYVGRGGTTTGPLAGRQRGAAVVSGEYLPAAARPAAAASRAGVPNPPNRTHVSMRRSGSAHEASVPAAMDSGPRRPGTGATLLAVTPIAASPARSQRRRRCWTACGANVLECRGFDPSPAPEGGVRLNGVAGTAADVSRRRPAPWTRGGRDERDVERRHARRGSSWSGWTDRPGR